MSGSTLPGDRPLITRTLEKPFLPGRQVFALYRDHAVIAIVRGVQELPERIYSPDGHDAWRAFSRARRVSVIPLAEVDRILSHESGTGNDATVKLTFVSNKAHRSVLLPVAEGTTALLYLADRYADILNPTAESSMDARRKMIRCLIGLCLLLDVWVAWSIWELWTTQSITGPSFLVDFMWYVYEQRGFRTAAAVMALGAVFFNLLMWVLSFATPTTQRRTLNCSNCGYLLRGMRSNRCPECGSTIAAEVQARGQTEARVSSDHDAGSR